MTPTISRDTSCLSITSVPETACRANDIHYNPARAGLMAGAEDYRWSSARSWRGWRRKDEPLRIGYAKAVIPAQLAAIIPFLEFATPGTRKDKAQKTIDDLLGKAGWHVQDRDNANVSAGRGVSVCSFPLKPAHGFAGGAGETFNGLVVNCVVVITIS